MMAAVLFVFLFEVDKKKGLVGRLVCTKHIHPCFPWLLCKKIAQLKFKTLENSFD